MNEFAPLLGVYTVTDDMCVCYTVQESPISDYVATDVSFLNGTKLWEAVVGHIQFVLREADLESAFLWTGACESLPQHITIAADEVNDHLRGLFGPDSPCELAVLISKK